MKRIFLVMVGLLIGLSAQAQGYKNPLKPGLWKKISNPSVSAGAQRAVSRAQWQQSQRLLSQQKLPPPLNNAMLTIKENHRFWKHLRRNGNVTAFVIEETYQGRRFLWGVAAAHSNFFKSAVVSPYTEELLEPSFALAGGLADIAIFPLPDELHSQVKPLQLAVQNPQKNEILYSVCFFENEYHLETNRIVQQSGPHRVITSLQIDRSCNRSGACGGPLLNEQGQVVAVHVGSHNKQDIGYAVPVEKLHALLQEYHHHTLSRENLIFNGKVIGTIPHNQFIRYIRAYHNGTLLQETKTYLQENNVDYAHLENLINAPQADELELVLAENTFPSRQEKQNLRAFVLRVKLTDPLQTTLKQNNSQHPLYKNAVSKAKRALAPLFPFYKK